MESGLPSHGQMYSVPLYPCIIEERRTDIMALCNSISHYIALIGFLVNSVYTSLQILTAFCLMQWQLGYGFFVVVLIAFC